MASNISEEEIQQLLRTVEMFEAITDSQSDDYQSLEILKEAYAKLGRRDDSLRASKKLAQAYSNLGQISQAILEYEGILQEYPDDPDVIAALAELEAKTSQFSALHSPGAPTLRVDSKPTPPAGAPAGAPASSKGASKSEDGNAALAEVLIGEKILTPQAARPLLQRLNAERSASAEKGQPLSLLQMLADEQIGKMEDLLNVLVDKSGLPYLPLSIYDIDRDVACLLPKGVCFNNGIIPFDLISRSVLIATTNPFDSTARNQAELMLPYNAFWYITSPAEITAALRRVYNMDSKAGSGAPTQNKS